VRRVGRQPCPAVPAAGVEPAVFSFSGRRSYHLSYTGIRETPAGVEPASRSGCSRPPEPSGSTSSGNRSRRWDSNPLGPRYEGGARPVEHRRHLFRAASVGVEPTRPRFRAPVPSRGPGQKFRASGGTRTRTRPFTGGVLDQSSCTGVVGQGWIAGCDPALRRSPRRMQPLHHTHHHSRSSIS
jgi:hypothetical protein